MSKEFDCFDCIATDAQLTAAREILRERGPREAVSLGDLLDTLGDRFPTEGAKKADSAVVCGLCCVALLGVWGTPTR